MDSLITLLRLEEFFSLLHTTTGSLTLTVLLLAFGGLFSRLSTRVKPELASKLTPLETLSFRKRLIVRKNFVWVGIWGVLTVLWAGKVAGMLLSLAALGGALLIVNRDLLQSAIGAMFFSFRKSVQVGDTVEIDRLVGRILNLTLFHVEIAEVGPSRKLTGRVAFVPNFMLLSQPFKNYSSLGNFGIHLIEVNLPAAHTKLGRAEQILLELAYETAGEWLDSANSIFETERLERLIDLPSTEPEIIVASPDEKTLRLTLRLACPINQRGFVEQRILKGFFLRYDEVVSRIEVGQPSKAGSDSLLLAKEVQ